MQLIDNKELKKYILDTFDQVDIFSEYLEIPESDITYCLQNKNYAINNPLRDDRDPSLGFMVTTDNHTNLCKIKMKDWADPSYNGDCFDLVGRLLHLNSKIGSDFVSICNDIIRTMKNKKARVKTTLSINTKHEVFTSIYIEPRLWNSKDIDLWASWGLPYKEVSCDVFPIQNSFISNFRDYSYDENDPGYAWITGYYNNKTLYTLYFPFRDKKVKFKPRFKKNNRFYPLECIHELKLADILCITKAFKEKLLIKRLLPKIKTNHTIQVSNFTSESIVLSKEFALKLYDIYPTVITNSDFDYTGLYTSKQHLQKYGMLRFIPTNGAFGTYDFGGKDLCDIYKRNGEQYCIDLMQEVYNYVSHQIDLEIDYFT